MVISVLSRIIRSEGPASLWYPIIKQQQATNAEMIINLKTAKMLSITLKHWTALRYRCVGRSKEFCGSGEHGPNQPTQRFPHPHDRQHHSHQGPRRAGVISPVGPEPQADWR